MNRRTFLASGIRGLGISALTPFGSATTHASSTITAQPGFSFLHYTDIHLETARHAPQGFQQCIGSMTAAAPHAKFAVCGGDVVFDALRTPLADTASLYSLFQEHAKSLRMPTHFVIGNHDIQSALSQPPVDTAHAKDLFRKSVNRESTYYSFKHGKWRFIVLDSIQPDPAIEWRAHIDDEQLKWLRQLLDADRTTPTVVITHVPLASSFEFLVNFMPGRRLDQAVVDNSQRVIDVLQTGNVKAVLQGHTHVVEQFERHGIKYVSSGSVCGEWWRGWRLGIFAEGYSLCHCSDDGVFQSIYKSYGWHAGQYNS